MLEKQNGSPLLEHLIKVQTAPKPVSQIPSEHYHSCFSIFYIINITHVQHLKWQSHIESKLQVCVYLYTYETVAHIFITDITALSTIKSKLQKTLVHNRLPQGGGNPYRCDPVFAYLQSFLFHTSVALPLFQSQTWYRQLHHAKP